MPKGVDDPRYRALIDKLTDARKRLGMSQQALAERLQMPQQLVSRYEQGERRLDVAEFIDAAIALGLSPTELIAEFVAED